MKTYTLKQIRRDHGKRVEAAIAAKEAVKVDTRAYIVPVSMLDLETEDTAVPCSGLHSFVVQERISADNPIPIRFGRSDEIKAWLISLARWKAMDKPEAVR